MRKFEGERWSPAIRRGIPTARYMDGGLVSGQPGATPGYNPQAKQAPMGVDDNGNGFDGTALLGLAEKQMAKKNSGMNSKLLNSIALGAVGGLGGGKGIAAAMAVQGANILKNYLDQKRAAGKKQAPQGTDDYGNPMKKGGKVAMKGRDANKQHPNKQVPAPKMKSGGATKKKGC